MTNDDKILKILGELSTNVATVLEEQQAQRTDIRSLHSDVGDLKKDVADLKNNAATKDDLEKVKIELKAEIIKNSKSYNVRITNLEEHVGISDPTKH